MKIPQGQLEIVHASAGQIEILHHLWSEYWQSLGLPSSFQNFAEEQASLPGEYAPPKGRLLLALFDQTPDQMLAGAIALRPLTSGTCEAKRLYVRPLYRGREIGRSLLTRLIEEARAEGYDCMYADTLRSMQPALNLYKQMGFLEAGPYSSNPTPGAIYLRKLL